MSALRLAFLVCAFGPPFCGVVIWGLIRLTFEGPLRPEHWQYLALFIGFCSIGFGLAYAGLLGSKDES